MELHKFKGYELIDLVKKRKISVYDMVKHFLERIEGENKEGNAFITINYKALDKAKELDEKLKEKGELGGLWGLPVAVKDNIAVKGILNTCASKMLENFISPYDGEVIELIEEEDGIIIGKTNMDEFGMGCSNTNSYYGKVKNPRNMNYSPGGSSGGSAAAVAGRMVPLALGSDTGGSIRQPASFCGVYGFKPSYGTVSRYGLTTFASTLDTIGPIGNSIEDVELLYSVISTRGKNDSTFVGKKKGKDNHKEIRVGIIKETFSEDVFKDKSILNELKSGIKKLENGGFKIKEFSMERIREALWCYYIISSSEAATTLSRFDGITFGHRSSEECKGVQELIKKNRSEGFGLEVKKRIMAGNFVISEGHRDDYYRKACSLREEITEKFRGFFEDVDVIIMATTPSIAFSFEEIENKNKIFQYEGDIFTVPASLGGFPAIVIPFGEYKDMPYNVQLIGNKYDDDNIFKYAQLITKCMRGDKLV